ncbi:hypothetical protein LSAT2_001465, partial [Lamellibrachia satsuma]
MGGRQLHKLFQTLPDTGEDNNYDKCAEALDKYFETERLKENVGDAIALVTQQEIVENLKTTREKCCKIGHFPACCHTRQSQGGATVGGKPHRGRGDVDRNSGRGRGKQNVRSIEKRDFAVEESDTFYVFSVNPSAYVMPINIEEKSMNMIVVPAVTYSLKPHS